MIKKSLLTVGLAFIGLNLYFLANAVATSYFRLNYFAHYILPFLGAGFIFVEEAGIHSKLTAKLLNWKAWSPSSSSA
jgi:hypothetical protein